jgi:TPR repeat protein
MGIFYHMGFGVSKNVDKAIEYLNKSAKEGNGQSSYQLFAIYSTEETHKDVVKAYKNLEKAIITGVTMFDVFH